MTALVIGGDGLVGSALSQREGMIATTRRPNDVRRPFLDLSEVKHLGSMFFENLVGPVDTVFLVAAITKVVLCEADPEVAWQINADAPVEIALQAKKLGKHVVFLSSDAVAKAPNLVYSRTKAHVESFILASGAGTVVRCERIDPAKVKNLVDLLVGVGETRETKLVRWPR